MAIGANKIILHFSVFVICFVFYRYNRLETINQQQQMTEADVAAPTVELKEIFGVTIESNPPQSKLDNLGVSSWPKWSGSPSKFPWEFTATETMYIQEGKVKVYCHGEDGFFEIGAGDLVVFPKGMKVTWEVVEEVNKHYHLEK